MGLSLVSQSSAKLHILLILPNSMCLVFSIKAGTSVLFLRTN